MVKTKRGREKDHRRHSPNEPTRPPTIMLLIIVRQFVRKSSEFSLSSFSISLKYCAFSMKYMDSQTTTTVFFFYFFFFFNLFVNQYNSICSYIQHSQLDKNTLQMLTNKSNETKKKKHANTE